jgi:hypothetical protein
MPSPVNGTASFVDHVGNTKRIKHYANKVDGTATIVCHYNYRDKPNRSYVSGFEHPNSINDTAPPKSQNNDIIVSSSAMFQNNKWRLVNAGEPQLNLFRELIDQGLIIYRQPILPTLQVDLTTAFSNGLFVHVYNSRNNYVPKMSSSGLNDTSRILKILMGFPSFKAHFFTVCSTFQGGYIGLVFVNDYDNTISRDVTIGTNEFSVEQLSRRDEIRKLKKRISNVKKRKVVTSKTSISHLVARYKIDILKKRLAIVNMQMNEIVTMDKPKMAIRRRTLL